MSRPNQEAEELEKAEKKAQQIQSVELKERSSKSLLANVLDIDDDFRHTCRPMTPGGTLPPNPAYFRSVFGYAATTHTRTHMRLHWHAKRSLLLFSSPLPRS